MMLRFDLIQQLIYSVETRGREEVQADPLLKRISGVLDGVESLTVAKGGADLIVLLKQALLSCESESVEGLRVPLNRKWPGIKEWQHFGFHVSSVGLDGLSLSIERWNPSWLDRSAGDVVTNSIVRRSRRPDRSVKSDPLIESKLHTDHYLSTSQRTAVQVAFLMPEGSTSLVVLPTGSGKSLIFQSPLFSTSFESGLTVVVVPTVALARDQDLRFRSFGLSNSSGVRTFAYHGGMSDDEKYLVRRGIEEGKIRVLFTSPEALITSLRRSLFRAAEQGHLNYFVVDEAHMIAQWGDSFRPEFQMLAGLRDALCDVCPKGRRFRTLLLTATMTSDCFDTLSSLFGVRDLRVVGDASLRSEIGFLIKNAAGESEREAYVIEALRELPRPLILYTTKREDAEAWYQRVCDLGFERARLVRGGDLSDEAGEQLLRDWSSGTIDLIVATSAFGLGVDQSEVRSVIHACLPESMDRFYQEVGRSGRDGRASASLTVTTPDDADIAAGLALQSRIGIDRGFERWHEMSIHGKQGADGTYIVSLNSRPKDIDYSGRRNASWNLRTLLLMRRAGILQFRPHLPPFLERTPDETEDSFLSRLKVALDRFSSEVAIRFLDAGHSDRRTWESKVATVRRLMRDTEVRSLERTKEVMNLKRPLNYIFEEMYTVAELGLIPSRFNGDCPFSREQGIVEYDEGFSPECLVSPPLTRRLSSGFAKALSSCRDDAGRYWIEVEPIPTQTLRRRSALRELGDFIGLCVAGGVMVVGVPKSLDTILDWDSLNTRAETGFVARTADGENLHHDIELPTLTVLVEEAVTQAAIASSMSLGISESVILFTSSLLDPRHAGRMLIDNVPHLPLATAISRLQA